MYKKVSFKDKLINILLSAIDLFSRTEIGNDEYSNILVSGKDIKKPSKKW